MTANTWIRGWDVHSHTDPLKKYRVSQALGGHYGCSCPRWKFSKMDGDGHRPDCKHITEIKTNLGLLNRVKGVERLDTRIVRAEVRTAEFIITELNAADLIASSKRKVRARDEF